MAKSLLIKDTTVSERAQIVREALGADGDCALQGGGRPIGQSPYSAMISCNDGFRPVSFYIQTIE